MPKVKWLGTNWRLVLAFVGMGLGGTLATVGALLYGDPYAAPFVGMAGALGGLVVFAGLASQLPLPASFYRRLPIGADSVCGEMSSDGPHIGTIGPGPKATDAPLVVGLELRVRKMPTLRLAEAQPLVIELEDGRRVHVEAGVVELGGDDGTFEALDEDAAQKIVASVGANPRAEHFEEDEGPIPTDEGRRWALAPGARVELRTATKVSPRGAHGGAFRTAANRDLVPVGVVRLHVLR